MPRLSWKPPQVQDNQSSLIQQKFKEVLFMDVKVRFAPSPTGKVHIGNIRTAIFNWLFARHSAGEFLLRVEDTDIERSTAEAKEALFDCMKWLGLDYDGEVLYQTSRADAHKEAAEKLQREGKAYKLPVDEGSSPVAFRFPWNLKELSFVRSSGSVEIDVHPEVPFVIDNTGVKYAQISKKGKPVETAACLTGYHSLKVFDASGNCVFEIDREIDSILNDGKSFSFENCSKASFERHEVFYNDMIKGELAKPLDSMKDLIIVRGDGSPVFHLANVCDDAEQKVTHIIRGDDHVENTYRHIFLFDALGLEPPHYAHLPMIVNQQGKPYSKRDGDAFVGDFRDKGFLGQALFNYLALLGWSPGDDREKMSRSELIEAFTIERVRSAPSQFDINKLNNMNGLYLAEMELNEFISATHRFALEKCEWSKDISADEWGRAASLMQGRAKVFADVESWKYFFSDELEYHEKTLRKTLKKDEVQNALNAFLGKLDSMNDFSSGSIEKTIREVEEPNGLNEGQLNKPLRVAVTAASGGADIYETLALVGKESVKKRIVKALSLLQELV
jgi:glutamyl-tRNA synthetase